jgi:hypothetical protein
MLTSRVLTCSLDICVLPPPPNMTSWPSTVIFMLAWSGDMVPYTAIASPSKERLTAALGSSEYLRICELEVTAVYGEEQT